MQDEGYSAAYEEALQLSTVAHREQIRKGSGFPYIMHPIHVSVILLQYGFSTEVAIAGLLHDVVEDQGYELSEIKKRFGPQVAEMVDAVSEQKRDAGGEKRPWAKRKQEAINRMQVASKEAVALKAADALHNVESFVGDLRREGPHMWHHFNQGPRLQLDYYRKIAAVSSERLGPHPLVDELNSAVRSLAEAIKETDSLE